MSPEQAFKIVSDESEAYAEAIVGRPKDREEYSIDIFRPGNSAELYLAQQTLLFHYQELLKGAAVQDGKNYPRAS